MLRSPSDDRRRRLVALRRPRPTQHRLDAGEQLLRGEGLRDVVVGAQAQASHLVLLGALRCQHDDRAARPLANEPADLEAVEAREHHVEHDQIGLVCREALQRLLAAGRARDAVAGGLEVEADDLQVARLVVDGEYPLSGHRHGSPRGSVRSRPRRWRLRPSVATLCREPYRFGTCSAVWRRLTLWPRLAIGVTIGFFVLFAGFSVLGIRAVDASTNRILHERLAITEELAQDFDGLLQHRFSDLTAFDARPSTTEREASAPRGDLPRERRRVHDAHPPRRERHRGRLARAGCAGDRHAARREGGTSRASSRAGGRSISAAVPRLAWQAGRRARASRSAPTAPCAGSSSARSTLAGPDVTERLDAARRLGSTGHAELVGPNGIALASTEPGPTLAPGEHLAFYREMLKAAQPGHRERPVTPTHHEPAGLGSTRHAMAFVRLSAAPWAVALGGTDERDIRSGAPPPADAHVRRRRLARRPLAAHPARRPLARAPGPRTSPAPPRRWPPGTSNER